LLYRNLVKILRQARLRINQLGSSPDLSQNTFQRAFTVRAFVALRWFGTAFFLGDDFINLEAVLGIEDVEKDAFAQVDLAFLHLQQVIKRVVKLVPRCELSDQISRHFVLKRSLTDDVCALFQS